jgi:hypothetical protein
LPVEVIRRNAYSKVLSAREGFSLQACNCAMLVNGKKKRNRGRWEVGAWGKWMLGYNRDYLRMSELHVQGHGKEFLGARLLQLRNCDCRQ